MPCWRQAALDAGVRTRALATFARLAEAEAVVHGSPVDDVHFHEVGALDAIADVVGACAGLEHLALEALVVSPVAVGGGHVGTEHGRLPVPAPAVAELLRGFPSYGGPVDLELCTPTGAALLVANATGTGGQPAMTTTAIGLGAGGRDPAGHTNALRLLVGVSTGSTTGAARPPGTRCCWRPTSTTSTRGSGRPRSPRSWRPGASDAWLTPILMKKGRPAHTLSVLVAADRAAAVRREIYRHTTSIGLREQPVGKRALDRELVTVDVEGHAVDVKLARLDGELLNLQPEYEHVAAAAEALGRPAKDVLQQAVAAARTLVAGP